MDLFTLISQLGGASKLIAISLGALIVYGASRIERLSMKIGLEESNPVLEDPDYPQWPT